MFPLVGTVLWIVWCKCQSMMYSSVKFWFLQRNRTLLLNFIKAWLMHNILPSMIGLRRVAGDLTVVVGLTSVHAIFSLILMDFDDPSSLLKAVTPELGKMNPNHTFSKVYKHSWLFQVAMLVSHRCLPNFHDSACPCFLISGSGINARSQWLCKLYWSDGNKPCFSE